MAKENSFDIVSETDAQEVENAFNNAVKALKQRYDLKDSGAELSYDKASGTLVAMRSWDSEMANSVPVSPSYLRGTASRSISRP